MRHTCYLLAKIAKPDLQVDPRAPNILFKDYSGDWFNVAAEAAKELGLIIVRGGNSKAAHLPNETISWVSRASARWLRNLGKVSFPRESAGRKQISFRLVQLRQGRLLPQALIPDISSF